MSYTQRIATIEQIVRSIEGTEDVDKVMRMHEEARAHLDLCRATIEAAKGKLEVVRGTDKPPA